MDSNDWLKQQWSQAKLGGFLGRKNNGDPGWQTLAEAGLNYC